jgi:hypothetical protein
VRDRIAKLTYNVGNKKMDAKTLKSLMEKYLLPENCCLTVPVVNTEIWNNMLPEARSFDIKMQKANQVLLGAQAALLQATDGVMNVWHKVAGNTRDEVKQQVEKLMDCVTLTAHACTEISFRRRELLVKTLAPKYKRLASEKVELTENLFGDNIRDSMGVIDRTNRLGASLQRYKPYYRGRGGYFPDQSSRGRGRGRGYGNRRGYGFQNQRGRGRANSF